MTDAIDPFRIRALVANFESISDDYRRMSDAVRASIEHVADLAYGAHSAARLDLFLPDKPVSAPVHLFIHGGYWRANRKEDYAFIAAPVTAAGAIAVIVEYPLMPGSRMAELVAHVRQAARWVCDNVADYGGDPGRMSASGHSAGAHLASYLTGTGPHEARPVVPAIRSLLLVSGIYDLAPITTSFLQAEIGLTPDEVAQWTPLVADQTGHVPVTLAIGSAETAPFQRQGEAFERQLAAVGRPVTRAIVPGENHMTIVREMGMPGSGLEGLLQACIAQSTL